MLYVTTRVCDDAFTANRALSENRGPNGGFYLPMRLPRLGEVELKELTKRSFTENMAWVLDRLFNTRLDRWALEFAIGRFPVKQVDLSGRIQIAESWHNPAWRFERLAKGVEKAIRQSDQVNGTPSDWLVVASRIAVLFGVFGQWMGAGRTDSEAKMDVVVPVGNFSAPMAAWYARLWGLPIGTIVVCCNENGGTWNLLHKGEIRTDAVAAKTVTPECDRMVPPGLERLIYSVLGSEETERFCETCRRGGTYYLDPAQRDALRRGIYVSVVSTQRLESAIPNLYKTDGYISDPYTALAYSGLCDYRSRTGENGSALILSEESPGYSFNFIARCMGLSPAALKKRLDQG